MDKNLEAQRALCRERSARYYEANRDAVKNRMREHARHKRYHLDESIKATREAIQNISLILETLTKTLNALEEKRALPRLEISS